MGKEAGREHDKNIPTWPLTRGYLPIGSRLLAANWRILRPCREGGFFQICFQSFHFIHLLLHLLYGQAAPISPATLTHGSPHSRYLIPVWGCINETGERFSDLVKDTQLGANLYNEFFSNTVIVSTIKFSTQRKDTYMCMELNGHLLKHFLP